jgi:hypothetical protein
VTAEDVGDPDVVLLSMASAKGVRTLQGFLRGSGSLVLHRTSPLDGSPLGR